MSYSKLSCDRIKHLIGQQFVDLLKGSALNVLAKIIATAIGFLSSILLARFYGPESIGILATITSIFTLGASVALLGMDTLILKLIPKFRDSNGENVFGIYSKILKLITVSGLFAGSALMLLDTYYRDIVPNVYVILPAALIVIAAVLRVNSSMLRALGDYKLFSTLDVLPSISMFAVVCVGGYFALSQNVFVYFYYISIVLVCGISFIFLRIYLSRLEKVDLVDGGLKVPGVSSLLKTSLPMLGVSLSVVATQHIDILLIGYYLDQGSVGVYAIYVRLASLVAFVTLSVNSMFAPKVALLFQAGKKDELRKFVKFTTALLSIGSLTIAIIFIFFHKFILNLYGAPYLLDPTSLYILLSSVLISSFFGSTGFFLNMTGGQRVFLWIMLLAALVNIVGNVLLIPKFGINGAAIASLVSVLIWNVLAMITIKRKHGFTLFFTGGL